jgi:hypothetical protein
MLLTLIHDAYMPTLERLKAVGGRGIVFTRTQNGAFCCILEIKSVQSILEMTYIYFD